MMMDGHRCFWILFGLALLLRLVLVAISHTVTHENDLHPAMWSDAASYYEMAELSSEGFERLKDGPHNRDRGWPLIVGSIFRITGPHPLVAQLTSVAFAMLSIWLTFRLARQFLSVGWATFADALWAFDPAFVGQSCLNLTETPAITMALISLNLMLAARQRGSSLIALVAACMLVLAFWTRTSTIVFAPAVVLWILGWSVSWSRRLGTSICFVLIMVGGWMTSSWMTYRWFGVFTPNTQSFLLFDHSAAKIMVRRGEADEFRQAIRMREERVLETLPENATLAEQLEAKKQSAKAYVLKHPWIQLRHQLQGLIATAIMPDRWSIPTLVAQRSGGGIWHGKGGVVDKVKKVMASWGIVTIVHAGLHLMLTGVLWCGTFMALPHLFRGKYRWIAWLLFLCVGAVLAGGAMSVVAVPRYRLPAEPIMAMLTALSFASWRERKMSV